MAIRDISEEPIEIRKKMASDADTGIRDLEKLANDDNLVVRTLVAYNPSTPESMAADLKNGKIMKPYCVDVYWCHDNWSWRAEDYVDNICDDFEDHAVVFSSEYDTTEAQWWVDTEDLLKEVWSGLQSAEDQEAFVDQYEKDWPISTLETIYDVWRDEGTPSELTEDTVAALVLEFYDDIDSERVYNPHGRYGDESAFILYDVNKVDIDAARDWIFGLVYELRLFSFDPEERLDVLVSDEYSDYDETGDVYEYYFDYGSEDDDELVTETELAAMKEKGLYQGIANKFGVDESEIMVVGDV